MSRYLMLLFFMILFMVGCGGSNHSTANSSVSTPALSKTTSGWEDSVALLLTPPVDLDDELDDVVYYLYNDNGISNYIADNGTLDERRAYAFYTCALYNDIDFTRLCLRTTPATEGYYDTQIASIASALGATVAESYYVPNRLITYYYLEWANSLTRQGLWTNCDSCLSNYAYVQYAGTVSRGEFLETSEDPNVLYEPGQSYSLMSTSAPIAWEVTKGIDDEDKPMYVAMIDTGAKMDHEDLATNLVNAGTRGYRVNFSSSGAAYDPSDSDGHGTGVASIICGLDNSVGVTGIAPECKVIPFNIRSDSGGPSEEGFLGAALRVHCIAQDSSWGINVVACNCSFSFHKGEERPAHYDATKALVDAGVYVISSDTGNRNPSEQGMFPGAYSWDVFDDEVISVSYLEFDNTWNSSRYYWSESYPGIIPYTAYANTDIFAPSRDLRVCAFDTNDNDTYSVFSGVSGGIPAVSAGIALLAASGATGDLKAQLLGMAKPISNFNVQDSYCTYCALDLTGIGSVEEAYLSPEACNYARRDTVVVTDDHEQLFIPDDPQTPAIDCAYGVNTFLQWEEDPVDYYAWLSYTMDIMDLEKTQSLRTVHLQQEANGVVSALMWFYDTDYSSIHKYYVSVLDPSTDTWSDLDPNSPVFTIDTGFPSPYNVVIDHVRYSSTTGIYIYKLPSSSYSYMYQYGGISDPSSTISQVHGEVQLCKGPGYTDTLVYRPDFNENINYHLLYTYNPTSGLSSVPVPGSGETTGNLFALGVVGDYPGFAWVNPTSSHFNVYTGDIQTNSLDWSYTTHFNYGDTSLRWSVPGTVKEAMLTGNSDSLPYLVVSVYDETVDRFIGYDGFRVNWPNAYKDSDPSEPGTYTIKEFIHGPNFSTSTENPSISSAVIDLEDRLNLYFNIDNTGFFKCKTLDYK